MMKSRPFRRFVSAALALLAASCVPLSVIYTAVKFTLGIHRRLFDEEWLTKRDE